MSSPKHDRAFLSGLPVRSGPISPPSQRQHSSTFSSRSGLGPLDQPLSNGLSSGSSKAMEPIDIADSPDDFHSFDGNDDQSEPPRKKQRASTPFQWNNNSNLSVQKSRSATPKSDNEISIDGIDPDVLALLGEDPKQYLKAARAEEKQREKELKLRKDREAKDHAAAKYLQELYNNGQDPDFSGDLAILSAAPASNSLSSTVTSNQRPSIGLPASSMPVKTPSFGNSSVGSTSGLDGTSFLAKDSRPYQSSAIPPHLARTLPGSLSSLASLPSQPTTKATNGVNGLSSATGRPPSSLPGSYPSPSTPNTTSTPYGSWGATTQPYAQPRTGLPTPALDPIAESRRRHEVLMKQMQEARERRTKMETASKVPDFIDLTTPSLGTSSSTSAEKRKFPDFASLDDFSAMAGTSSTYGKVYGKPSGPATNGLKGISGSYPYSSMSSSMANPYAARNGITPSTSTPSSANGFLSGSGLLGSIADRAKSFASTAGRVYGDFIASMTDSERKVLKNRLLGDDYSRAVPLDDDDDWSDDDLQGFLIDRLSGINDYGPNGYADGVDYWTRSDPAKVQEELRDLMNNIRPDTDLGAAERKDTPDAMSESANLYPHQQLGLAWLVSMETSKSKGGILADDMGLGKTIQAIALMVSRRSEDENCKTTLIIAPVALMKQWESEIKTKVKPQFELKTHMYYGASGKNIDWKRLKKFDVVITSYGTVGSEYKRSLEIEQRRKNNPGWRPTNKADALPLFDDQSVFYRIILDEAQNVKNKTTRGAKAVHALQAKYRLCMTGTPMMNNIGELFSLVHFLRIKPYCEFEKFSADFILPLKKNYRGAQAMQKLQAFLKAILLRRTKKSEIDGKPILTLPERTTMVTHSEFDEGQMDFYTALQTNAQIQFSKYVKAGTIGKNYANVLVMLLRLRQACCHPHLIADFADEHMGDPEQREENCLARAKDLTASVVARLNGEGVVECPICMDAPQNATIFLPCGHYCCLECFTHLVDNARQAGNESNTKFSCPNCRAPIDPNNVTDWQSFQTVWNPDEATKAAGTIAGANDEDDDDEDDIDSEDSDSEVEEEGDEVAMKDEMKDFIVDEDASIKQDDSDNEYLAGDSDEEDLDAKIEREQRDKRRFKQLRHPKRAVIDSDSEDDDNDLDAKPKSLGYGEGSNPFQMAKTQKSLPNGETTEKKSDKPESKDKGKGKARRDPNRPKKKKVGLAQLKKESTKNAASLAKYHKRLRKEFVSSAKIETTMQLLRQIRDRGNNEKTIIFSQFTSLLDLLQIPIMDEGWGMRRYDGSMSAGLRHDAVMDFSSNPNSTVMLVSLKAGNSGLNLTSANNVIIFDPFWNPYIEEQAIDRAHRIGQRRPVNVYRILVKETVEDRIVALQEKKRALIEGALDEAASRNVGRLTTQELSYLFGVSPTASGAR